MIEVLDDDLSTFSEVNRVRCFLHIVNLIAKSLLKEFDGRKQGPRIFDQSGDEAEVDCHLEELTQNFEAEELTTQDEREDDGGEEEELEDVEDVLDEQDRAIFKREGKHVHLVLSKVLCPSKNDKKKLTTFF
jgi:hypothetical protein